MASDRKTASNRRNAARSTGPKSRTGKERSALNALSHGLSARPVFHAATRSRIGDLARMFAKGSDGDPAIMEVAGEAAEAQIMLEHIRGLRGQVWEGATRHRFITERGKLHMLKDPRQDRKFKDEFNLGFRNLKKLLPYMAAEPFGSDVEREVAVVDLATIELVRFIRYERQAANRRDRALRALEERRREGR